MTPTPYTPAGGDFGNGFVNIDINGMVVKIPNCYSYTEPTPEIRKKTDNEISLKAHCVEIDGKPHWFGQDVLGHPNPIRLIDTLKYKSDHLQKLWLGALAIWSEKYNIDLESLGHIKVVTGMPAQLYPNQKIRLHAIKAYRGALRSTKTGRNDTRQRIMGRRITSTYMAIEPEAVAYGKVRKFKSKVMIVLDIGSGTVDIAVFVKGQPAPLSRVTENNGLYSLYATQDVNQNRAELQYLRNLGNPDDLEAQFSHTATRLALFHRQLPAALQEDVGITLIGGGAVMGSNYFQSTLANLFDPIIVGDEFENARYFRDIATRKVNELQN